MNASRGRPFRSATISSMDCEEVGCGVKVSATSADDSGVEEAAETAAMACGPQPVTRVMSTHKVRSGNFFMDIADRSGQDRLRSNHH